MTQLHCVTRPSPKLRKPCKHGSHPSIPSASGGTGMSGSCIGGGCPAIGGCGAQLRRWVRDGAQFRHEKKCASCFSTEETIAENRGLELPPQRPGGIPSQSLMHALAVAIPTPAGNPKNHQRSFTEKQPHAPVASPQPGDPPWRKALRWQAERIADGCSQQHARDLFLSSWLRRGLKSLRSGGVAMG